MMEKLRQLEREAITAFEKTRVSRIEKLHSGKASVVSFKKQLGQAFEFSNNLDERGSSSDIMQNKKNVKERIAHQDHNASSSGKLVCRICVDM